MYWVPVSQNRRLNTSIILPLVLFLDVKQYHHVLDVVANIGKLVMDLVKESSQFRHIDLFYESFLQKPDQHLCWTCGNHMHRKQSSMIGHN